MKVDRNQIIESILAQKGTDSAIPLLHAIQDQFNYLPEDVLKEVCERTDISPSQIMGIASFYTQFRLQPTGKHIVRVCTGTACHVKRAELVYDALTRALKLPNGHNTDDEGNYTLEKVHCLGCCTLAPVVQISNVTYGHVNVDKAEKILKSFELNMDRSQTEGVGLNNQGYLEGEIRIGLGSCCVASGSEAVRNSVKSMIAEDDLNVRLKRVGCVGMCHQVPLLEVLPKDEPSVLYHKVKPDDIKKILNQHFRPKGLWSKIRSSVYHWIEDIQSDQHWDGLESYPTGVREEEVSSFLGKQVSISSEFRGAIDPLDIDEYKLHRGFVGFKKAINSYGPHEIIDKVKNSGLRGRGGAGFPTGSKWEIFRDQKSDIKYLICNGDEGDPGAFMDRMLLESYPYRIIEGMIITAYATGATKGYFYIRAEYQLAVSRIRKAILVCRDQGYLGQNIMDSGLDFDIYVFEGAGAFICGEETALIASIEGKRGFPHLRPPYPVEKGLWNRPTLVNNTETFAQVPYIIRNDLERYTVLGTPNSKGTKVFALAGKVNRGGLIEVPMGITVREIIEDIGGGVADGKKLKAVQIGGPSGGCIPYWLIDTPIDYQSLHEVGAMMGSGGLVVLDETDCMVDMARYFLSFTQSESCGKCTFCRIGTKRMLDILDKICAGKGATDDLIELEKLAKWTMKGSVCGLGQTAPNPVLSTLRYFRHEYEAHINQRCPAGKCQELIAYEIDNTCIGCTICVQNCPTDAIAFTPFEVHTIDQQLCIKCDSCRQVCPEDAVSVS